MHCHSLSGQTQKQVWGFGFVALLRGWDGVTVSLSQVASTTFTETHFCSGWSSSMYQLTCTSDRHSTPPESCAGMLDVNNEEHQKRAAEQLQRDHLLILRLDRTRHELPDARQLWEAIPFLRSTPVRLIFEFYKRDGYAPNSRDGKKLLCGFLVTMESNKSVEDVHQPIRMAANANQNLRLSKDEIQNIINHSGSFEARGVPDGPRVPKVA
jgi:hypothetical protein